jgi:hypothetical protein
VTLADCKIITSGDGPLGVDVRFSSRAELDDLIEALILLRDATDFDHVHLQDRMISGCSPSASTEIVFHLPGSCFDSIQQELVAEAGRRIEAASVPPRNAPVAQNNLKHGPVHAHGHAQLNEGLGHK